MQKNWIVCSNYLPNYSTGIYSGRTMPFCALCNYFSFAELVRRGAVLETIGITFVDMLTFTVR